MKKHVETFLFLCYIIFERITIMDKNYYDILQINRNASPEIIEKAYKTLAKKYHPDLQEEENKKQAEEILKEINEAYEVLSNVEKKQIYDQSLSEQEQARTTTNDNYTTTPPPTSSANSTTHQISREEWLKQQELLRKQYLREQEQIQREQEIAYQEQLQQARQKAYHDAYIQDLKNRGYKIRYKKSFKDYIKGFISIIITIFILFLLWQIPFIKNFFMDLYENNSLLQIIEK